MANREACELYIEQQIEEALEEGKTPYSIGKEISSMIERIFETKIPARTLEQRARRQINATNVANDSTAENDNKTKEEDKKNKEDLPLCKNGCKKPVYINRVKPYGANSKYHGLCVTCMDRLKRKIRKEKAEIVAVATKTETTPQAKEPQDQINKDEQRKLWNQVTLKLKNINSIIETQTKLPPFAALNNEEAKELRLACESFGFLMQHYEGVRICVKP